ncbi:MAG: hypothetical protein GY950_07935 [bacterium]|nr:hypothetical protein [bacterium]
MDKTKKILVCSAVVMVLLAAVGCPNGSGNGSNEPCTKNWSGYWWPMLPNSGCNLFSPGGAAEKYDNYVKAVKGSNPGWNTWEKNNHDGGPGVESWWGHCHALASASILENEPCKSVKKSGVTFSILDQKGMLTECHYNDPTAFIVYADTAVKFHSNLLSAMGTPQSTTLKPVVMDKNSGYQVWNHVIIDYEMTQGTDAGDPGKTNVKTTVTYLDYGPCDSSYKGRKKRTAKYTYWIKGNFENPSSGEWTGDSSTDHPHFFWYPDYQKKEPGCPIDYTIVKEIINQQGGTL